MQRLSRTELLVKASYCYIAAWACRADREIARELIRRARQAEAEYDRRAPPNPAISTVAAPVEAAPPPPRPSLLDRIAAVRWGGDWLC